MRRKEANKKESSSLGSYWAGSTRIQMDNIKLKSQLHSLQESLEFSRSERATLESQLKSLQGGTRDAEAQIVELSKQCRELRALLACAMRLLAAGSREGTFHAVQDIVANVIGSEEIALFEMNTEGTALCPSAWCGANIPEGTSVAVGEGWVGQVALTGTAFTSPGNGSGMAACIPLRASEKIIGVLAIYSLLPQKWQLEPWDIAVLKLLECEAGRLLARYPQEEDTRS